MIEVPTALRSRFPAKFWKGIERTQFFSMDLETSPPSGGKPSDAKDARKAIPTLMTLSTARYDGAFDMTDPACHDLIAWLLQQEELEVVIHNTLYDLIVLDTQGICKVAMIKAKVRDSMILQFMINELADKGLKEMSALHLRRRMKTYDETTVKNPKWLRIRELEDRIDHYHKLADNFQRARPWPNFDSKNVVTLADIRKHIRKRLDERWPGEETEDKNGKTRRKFTKDESAARKVFREEKAELIEQHFGFQAQMDFEGWIHTHVVIPAQEEIEQLRVALNRDLVIYAKEDSRNTHDLWKRLEPKIRNQGLGHWLDIECYVRYVTTKMSATGIPTDVNYLEQLKDIVDPFIAEFEEQVRASAGRANYENSKGEELNPNSPDQLRECIFLNMNADIPVFFRRSDGRELPKLNGEGDKWLLMNPRIEERLDLRKPETIPRVLREKYLACDAEVLERIDHPIGQQILNLRALTKIRGTYITGSITKVTANEFGRLLGYFNSIGTDTGRLSSRDPNLQNIPSRKKPANYDERIQGIGPKLRDAFVASPGKVMIVADQSQIELRIITHFTKDKTLREIYTQCVEIDGVRYYTGDIHLRTSTDLAIPRKLAKNVNFGFNYGMGPLKFARQIRLFDELGNYDIPKATIWRDGFFRSYPGIEDYSRLLKRQFTNERKREFKMLSGRIKHYWRDDSMRGGTILNHKVQGSSADLLKINMMIIDQFVTPVCPSLELLFQVHDELGYQCDPEEAELAAMLVKFVMEEPWIPMDVPVIASAKTCPSWAAKDDDAIPEIGTFYARVDGEDMTFTKDQWPEYLAIEADPDRKIELKSACAILTHEQKAECRKYIPRPQDVPELASYFAAA